MDIRFYHLQNQTIHQALPALVSKAYSGGHKICIRVADETSAQSLSDALWSARPDSFLAHGTPKLGKAEHQPIWITHEDDNANGANVIILTEGVTTDITDGIDMLCDVFDGRDDMAVAEARTRWKAHKDSDAELTYWQQNPQGGWDKKA